MLADITHFSMVGFPLEISSNAALNRAADAQLKSADQRGVVRCQPAPGDAEKRVCVIRDPSGGELWYGLRNRSDHSEMITLNPAFKGEGRARLQIDGDVSEAAWKPFEIGLYARFSGEETPIVFELADPEQVALAKPGAEVTVSLAAFSYAPDVFKTEKEYHAAQRKAGVKYSFAANMFIPSGTFFEKVGGAMPDDAKHPVPYADFAGAVLKADLRTNSAGGGKFWAVLARTYGGATVDVVIDPASIQIEPKPGYIVSGRFWLTGRIVPSL